MAGGEPAPNPAHRAAHGDADVERQESAGLHGLPAAPHQPWLRMGSLDNLRWNAGNREGGREDEGSVHGSSRSGSRHGGSAFGGSLHGGSAFGGDRSVHGGSRLANGSQHGGRAFAAVAAKPSPDGSRHGSRHGGSHHGGGPPDGGGSIGRLALHADGSSHGGGRFYSSGRLESGSAEDGFRQPGYELPGQGGPMQDNAGLSAGSMRAQAQHQHDSSIVEKAVVKPAKGALSLLRKLLRLWSGGQDTAHPRPDRWWVLLVMPFGAFLSILWVSGINRYTQPDINMRILIPSFGASAVLLFAVPESKLSQPRSFLGGQFVSVLVGCVCRNIFPDSVNWVAAPVAVGFSVLAMMVTRTVHPPGGATALTVASEIPHGRWASFIYVPAVMIGSLGMLIIAMVMNLVAPGRRYPTFWWGADNFFGGL